MAKAKDLPGGKVYHLKIVLDGIEPPVWRRVLVPADTGLDRLHQIVQIVMGWENAHMHQWHVGKVRYGRPDRELGTKNESSVTIAEVAPPARSKFIYEYDFGDSWLHAVTVEKIETLTPMIPHPVCDNGERACPPEDCGGAWGYEEMLQVLADPKHEEHEERLEWLGEEFDPEEFDLGRLNRRLKKMPKPRRGWVKADGVT